MRQACRARPSVIGSGVEPARSTRGWRPASTRAPMTRARAARLPFACAMPPTSSHRSARPGDGPPAVTCACVGARRARGHRRRRVAHDRSAARPARRAALVRAIALVAARGGRRAGADRAADAAARAARVRRRCVARGRGIALGLTLQPDGAGDRRHRTIVARRSAAMRLPRRAGVLRLPGSRSAAQAIGDRRSSLDRAGDAILALAALGRCRGSSCIRLMRALREGRDRGARRCVEELRESRAAHAEAAALGRARRALAREMHDVLAHSLSALALQLEGARLLARDRDADPEVDRGDRARPPPRRAAGLDEARARDRRAARRRAARARAAAGARRGVQRARRRRLHARRRPASRASCALRGAARALPHRPGGADQRAPPRRRPTGSRCGSTTAPTARTLVVAGPRPGRARRSRRAAEPGGGYGLTGMRERAELLGGRLRAGADRRRLPGRAVACRRERDPRPARRRPARRPRGARRRCSGCSTGIELVGTAADGEEAVALVGRARPRRRADGPADAARRRHRGDPPAGRARASAPRGHRAHHLRRRRRRCSARCAPAPAAT